VIHPTLKAKLWVIRWRLRAAYLRNELGFAIEMLGVFARRTRIQLLLFILKLPDHLSALVVAIFAHRNS
jgi:hypothetical protein